MSCFYWTELRSHEGDVAKSASFGQVAGAWEQLVKLLFVEGLASI